MTIFTISFGGKLVPATYEKEIQEVDKLYLQGDVHKALKIIDKTVKKEGITKEEEFLLLIYKCLIKLLLGSFDESLQIAKGILKESKKIGNKIFQAEALVWFGGNYLYTNRFNEAVESVDKGLELISTIPDFPRKKLVKSMLLYWKADTMGYIRDYDNCVKILKEAISLAEEYGDKFLIANHYIYAAGVYSGGINDTKTGLEYIEKGEKIAHELGNKFLIAFHCQIFQGFKIRKREYEEAIDLLNKMLSLSDEIGSTVFLNFKSFLGELYLRMFQIDKALEIFFESLDYTESKQYIYSYIGSIYFMKYKIEKAQKYLQQSIEISKKAGDKGAISRNLYELIRIQIELNNISKAKGYLDQLAELDKETGFRLINYEYRLAKVIFLKASNEMTDLVEAVKILKSLLDEEGLSPSQRLDVLYSLLEIRIKELQLSANEATLEEAWKQSIRLEVEVEEQHLQELLVNIYRLQSQLALIELNAEKALKLLDKAQTVADEIDVELLKKKINEDREKISQQLDMWNNLQQQKAPVSEAVKLVSLEKTVQNIAKDTVIEERDEETGRIIEYRKLFSLRI
jgi:tetratricopeptide (TPR) repeat protein